MTRKLIFTIAALIVGGFLLIQLVPYGRNHANPPVVQEPAWGSPTTRELAMQACGDCHANNSTWPWYSNVAPVSWLVYHDTMEGRQRLNFSEWNRPQEGDDAAEQVTRGEMPPAIFLAMHPEARLTAAEKEQLIQGLRATFGERQGGARREKDNG